MFIKTLLLFIVFVGIAVFLLNIKAVFKKNGKLEKSCTAKHRLLREKGIECASCGSDPLTCGLDQKEHDDFIHPGNHSE